MAVAIQALASFLPAHMVTNEDLHRAYPDWSVDRIAEKTGILERRLAAPTECASDLAAQAAQRLFASGVCRPEEIDFLLLCTQTPDFFLPTTACLLQERLGLPRHAGALDFNLGCSGYIYGLGMAQGLLSTRQASRLLLLTADTYSRFIDPADRSSATIFGDGATATLLANVPEAGLSHAPVYVYGTDGRGGEHLMVRNGGMRQRCAVDGSAAGEAERAAAADPVLWMNGPEIFSFASRIVPNCVRDVLQRAGKGLHDVDLFVFHQANRYMLEHLRRRLGIPEERFYISLAKTGNTVAGTIPIALEAALGEGRLRPGQTVLLVGFGVGLSWGATLLTWPRLGVPAA